jgi:hypothetical protein
VRLYQRPVQGAFGQKVGVILSNVNDLAFHFPIGLVRPIRKPKGFVVIFHGRPNPEEMAQRPFKRWGSPEKFGYFPVAWIKDYWRKYGG